MKNLTFLSRSRIYSALWPFIIATFLFGGHDSNIEMTDKNADVPLPVVDFVTSGNGNWSDNSNWVGGIAPGSTLNNKTVDILHEIIYDLSNDLEINGGSVLHLNGGKLIVIVSNPRNIKVGESGDGTFKMTLGELEMLATSGNLSFKENSNAVIKDSSIKVAGDWESLHNSTNRSFEGGCLFIENGNFKNLGDDTYNGVCLEIKNGSWSNEGTVTVGPIGIVVKASNGNFENKSLVNGTGHFKFVMVQASGTIKNDGTWNDAVDMQAYCWDGSNGSISGFPMDTPNSEDCSIDGNFFPCTNCLTGPLPIDLSSFTGHAMDKTNMLKWTTASENGNAYFQVQRSVDGREFEIIGQVTGNGTSDSDSHYSFEDESPFAFAYYRLQQVDHNGNFSFSSLVNIEREKFNIHLAIYPNIAEEEVTIRINTLGKVQDSRKYILKVVNAQGLLMYEKTVRSPNYTEYIDLSVTDYQTGMYYVFLQNLNDRYSAKFVVQNRK